MAQHGLGSVASMENALPGKCGAFVKLPALGLGHFGRTSVALALRPPSLGPALLASLPGKVGFGTPGLPHPHPHPRVSFRQHHAAPIARPPLRVKKQTRLFLAHKNVTSLGGAEKLEKSDYPWGMGERPVGQSQRKHLLAIRRTSPFCLGDE